MDRIEQYDSCSSTQPYSPLSSSSQVLDLTWFDEQEQKARAEVRNALANVDTLAQPPSNMVSNASMGVGTSDTDVYEVDTLTHGLLPTDQGTEADDSKKTNFRFRNWKWTINLKYSADSKKTDRDALGAARVIAEELERRLAHGWRYCFQIEQGKEGVIHLQGFCGGANATWRNAVLSMLSCYGIKPWLKTCTGNPSKWIEYCQKEETRIDGPWKKGVDEPKAPTAAVVPVKDPLADRPMYAWQNAIVQQLAEEPNDREVLWIHDALGGAGKTALCKHLCLKYKALLVGGKVSDATYALAKYADEKKPFPTIVIFNFTRSQEQFASYQAIESIKDGCFFSGKYESGMVLMNSPHVVCMANFPPDYGKLSSDRWKVYTIVRPASTDNIELRLDANGHVPSSVTLDVDQ